MSAPLLVAPKRCAVYCRVSSDERPDQSFNSPDAQKEAGHAFIKSQAHEGWIAVADDYAKTFETSNPTLYKSYVDKKRKYLNVYTGW
jgi:hypothetical protein